MSVRQYLGGWGCHPAAFRSTCLKFNIQFGNQAAAAHQMNVDLPGKNGVFHSH